MGSLRSDHELTCSFSRSRYLVTICPLARMLTMQGCRSSTNECSYSWPLGDEPYGGMSKTGQGVTFVPRQRNQGGNPVFASLGRFLTEKSQYLVEPDTDRPSPTHLGGR